MSTIRDKTSCDHDKQSSGASTSYGECELPEGLRPVESQVGGHVFNSTKDLIGMLRTTKGHVLKPVNKPHLGEREIAFYESLKTSTDAMMQELKNYVPRYFGTTELQMFNRRVNFLVLQDITEGMAEPCVIDIKIGKRTWDPLATPEKRATEEQKYIQSKQAYGFCITAFQVYNLPSGELKKFDKNYGKRLDPKGVVEALRIFLNASPQNQPCRQLIVRLLSLLWKIQGFFRKQRKFSFYSSSVLVAYDARRLRYYLRSEEQGLHGEVACHRTRSLSSLNGAASKGVASTQATSSPLTIVRNKSLDRTRLLKRSLSLRSCYESLENERILYRSGSHSPELRSDRLCRTHSSDNNFDNDLIKMKEDYMMLLNELSSTSEEKQNWVRVNMIDFTHIFPMDSDCNLDLNYLQGIENLVKIFETFLENTRTSA